MFKRPRRNYALLVLALAVTLAISGIGGDSTASSDALRYWVGATGWATFAFLFVATVLFTLALGVRAFAHRTPSTTPIDRSQS
jgi:hypothetical protein